MMKAEGLMFHLPQILVRAPQVRRCVVVLVALAATGSFYFKHRVAPLQEVLVTDTVALLSRSIARPAHVTPALPGSFADGVLPHWAGLGDAQRQMGELSHADWLLGMAVLSGEQPYPRLPAGFKSILRKSRPAVEGLLRATRASSTQPPNCLWEDSLRKNPCLRVYPRIYFGAHLGLLDARRLLSEGNVDAALEEGMDVLALSRDLAHFGVVGDLLGIRLSRWAFRLCAQALDAASPMAKSYAVHQFQLIEAGTPSMATVMKRERLFRQLGLFAKTLSPTQRKRLPKSMQETLARGGHSFLEDQALRFVWPSAEAGFREVQAAVALPAQERDQRLRHPWPGLGTLERAAWNYLGGATYDSLWDFQSYDVRHRCAAMRLSVLRAAALVDLSQAQEGRWPASVALNGAPGQIERPQISLHIEGDTTWVRGPTLTKDERRECEIEPAVLLHRDEAL